VCTSSLAPDARDEYVALYGEGGSCWGVDLQRWATCRESCRQALDAVNLAAELTGQYCGTCQSDADCSEFGVGATCAEDYCLPGDPIAGESGGEHSGDGDGDGDDPWEAIEAVSILLVVDNSGSMGGIQRVLAENVYSMVEPLESAGIPWRLGITTTDSANPWCPSGTFSSEEGRLVLSSCRTRLTDFLFNQAQVNVQAHTCTDICNLDELSTIPTLMAIDPTPASRPWIESDGAGITNLLGEPSLAAALACTVPQGINGCGFESQLESAQLALARAHSKDEEQYAFVEEGRLLAIVFVSDEADCSDNPDFASIFEADGGKTFWSDPSAQFPTSAVCWNAGVQCVGDPSGYDACNPVNLDLNGNKTSEPQLAVMTPVQEFIEDFAAGPVVAFGILGVAADGQPRYANTDPEAQDTWGIDPGCTGTNAWGPVEAIPPVRMWKVMQELGPKGGQAAYSICADAFGSGLQQIGAMIASYF
jgi:hypothetical protein